MFLTAKRANGIVGQNECHVAIAVISTTVQSCRSYSAPPLASRNLGVFESWRVDRSDRKSDRHAAPVRAGALRGIINSGDNREIPGGYAVR